MFIGSLGRTKGPHITAAACLAFLDTTLRQSPDNLTTVLPAYGQLTIHHPPGPVR